VGWSERGVVTANNLFFRSIGSAVGVAVFGAIANATLGSASGAVTAPAIAEATHDVFIAALVLAVVMVAAAFLLPGGKPVIAEAAAPPDPAVDQVPETTGDEPSAVTAPRRPADRSGSVPRRSDPE
jgi:hypothetical protein